MATRFGTCAHRPVRRAEHISEGGQELDTRDLPPFFPALNYLDYEQSPFFLCPSSKTPETRKWPRAWLKARDGRGKTLSRAAALVSRVSRLRRSTLARGCTTLAKSELPNAAPLLCLTRLCVPFFLTNEYNYDWRQAYWYRQISSKFGKR